MNRDLKEVKINLGCGEDYRHGWVNVDFNKEVKADFYADFAKKLPFKDNYADFILLDNVLEHITPDKFFFFIEELHRVSKNGAKIKICVPHYSSMYALKHPTHYKYFGIGTFDILRPEKIFNGERYTAARFSLEDERLLFFHHNLQSMKFLSKIPINWMFNFGRAWQTLMERFQFFGFDEIIYELKAVK